MPSYWLNPNIHFCLCDDALIFLDVARDSYFRFSGKQRDWFETIRAARTIRELGGPAASFAERLVSRQILTRDGLAGKPLSDPCFTPPGACLTSLSVAATPSHILATTRDMALAVASAWWLEHMYAFEDVVACVGRWKRRATRREDPSLEEVLEAASRFHAITPYFFSTHDACRFRSIALMRFLTRLGLQPDWVFGVRLCPFGAHCWVEYKSIILNEDSDTVAEFRPIMSV